MTVRMDYRRSQEMTEKDKTEKDRENTGGHKNKNPDNNSCFFVSFFKNFKWFSTNNFDPK